MRVLDLAGRLPFLTRERVAGLNSLVDGAPYVTGPQIKTALGVTLPDAVALMAVLGAAGVGEYGFNLYHRCDNFLMPSKFLGKADGMPRLPWHCENCDEDVLDEGEVAVENAFHIHEEFSLVVAAS